MLIITPQIHQSRLYDIQQHYGPNHLDSDQEHNSFDSNSIGAAAMSSPHSHELNQN
jgi:hypothetical protein